MRTKADALPAPPQDVETHQERAQRLTLEQQQAVSAAAAAEVGAAEKSDNKRKRVPSGNTAVAASRRPSTAAARRAAKRLRRQNKKEAEKAKKKVHSAQSYTPRLMLLLTFANDERLMCSPSDAGRSSRLTKGEYTCSVHAHVQSHWRRLSITAAAEVPMCEEARHKSTCG